MDPFSDSSELYHVKQQFFCGQFDQVIKNEVDSFSPEATYKGTEYIVRSHLALSQFDEAKAVISTEAKEGDELTKLEFLKQYTDYAKSGSGSDKIEEYIENYPHLEVVAVLGGVYLVSQGKFDAALELLSAVESSLETVALAIQIRIITNRLDLASKELSNAKKWAQDDIVFNLAESWVNVASGKFNNLQSAFYFYEEISQGHTSFKNLVGLLALNLQLHHFVESKEVLNQIEQLGGESKYAGDYLANKAAYDAITGEDDFFKTMESLKQVDPKHQFIVDYEEKSTLFDGIVTKYEDQIKA